MCLGENVEAMDNQPVDTKKNQIQNRYSLLFKVCNVKGQCIGMEAT